MNIKKIREALELSRKVGVKMEWDDIRDRCEEALAELDAAPKVLTDKEAHYLFMGWLHANHADINDNADMSDLCRRAFIDSLRYARENGYLPPSAGLTVEEAYEAACKAYNEYSADQAPMTWGQYLRACLNEKLKTKNQ